MRVHISDANIAQGKPQNSTACPVVLALQELYPSAKINVDKKYATISNDKEIDVYKLDAGGRVFVHDFDHLLPVHPTEIVLTLVDLENEPNLWPAT